MVSNSIKSVECAGMGSDLNKEGVRHNNMSLLNAPPISTTLKAFGSSNLDFEIIGS